MTKSKPTKEKEEEKTFRAKKCPAIIRCGGGHQSKGKCDVEGKHSQHHYEGHNGDYFWSKKEAYTTVFDESPEELDELKIHRIIRWVPT